MPEEVLRLPQGEIEDEDSVSPAVIALIQATTGDPALNRSRGQLIGGGARVMTSFRPGLQSVGRELRDLILAEEDEGRISLVTRRAVMTQAALLMSPIFNGMEEALADSAEIAARREIATLLRFLRAQDFDLPPRSEMRLLIQAAILQTVHDYANRPFFGLTPSERMEMHRRRAMVRIRRALQRNRNMAARQAELVINGRTGTRVGSVLGDGIRLGTAERARVAGQAGVALVRGLGMSYSYWRLSESHVYRGGEHCEFLAGRTGPGVISSLEASGARISRIPLRGLHLTSDWPAPPHPNCRCYLEPAFIL